MGAVGSACVFWRSPNRSRWMCLVSSSRGTNGASLNGSSSFGVAALRQRVPVTARIRALSL
ncbi:hypothetical protein DWB77_00405 [Streptomyces hundungensis]|uniref:Uncharacterized protein n=1 Tax=Streptomyces hundungensis TaxID=1077946 RepID=A0A387HCD6_9ACTN|nr:hypothetical protein DWB77_00405 [Streptomyces hundungensis]